MSQVRALLGPVVYFIFSSLYYKRTSTSVDFAVPLFSFGIVKMVRPECVFSMFLVSFSLRAGGKKHKVPEKTQYLNKLSPTLTIIN